MDLAFAQIVAVLWLWVPAPCTDRPRGRGQRHPICVLGTSVFSTQILGLSRNDQLSSSLDLSLLCTIGNICTYPILKYSIFSSRNEQYHSLRQRVPRAGSGTFGLVPSGCPSKSPTRRSHGKASSRWTPGSGAPSRLRPTAPAPRPPAISACKLGPHNHTLYSADTRPPLSPPPGNVFGTPSFPQMRKWGSAGSGPTLLSGLRQTRGKAGTPGRVSSCTYSTFRLCTAVPDSRMSSGSVQSPAAFRAQCCRNEADRGSSSYV